MPVVALGGGRYRWGKSGRVYSGAGAREKAERQGRAVLATGWRDSKPDNLSLAAARRALKASARAEGRYVRDLQSVVARIHEAVEKVVEPHLAAVSRRADDERAPPPDFAPFHKGLFVYVKRQVGKAYDRMAELVNDKNHEAMRAVGLAAPVVVNKSGMRPESIEMVRAQRARGEPMRPVVIAVYPGQPPVLEDGRHRVEVARALGDEFVDAVVRHYGPRGGLQKTETTRLAVAEVPLRAPESLIGITPAAAGVAGLIESARDTNIALIEQAGRDYADQVRALLEDPDNFGLRVEDLRDLVAERAEVSESRAALIARDQTLKLNAALTKHRQTASGVDRYTWSTSDDERVRPTHADLEGETFDWDDPPVTNDDGDTNHPGEDYQCRCIALPVIEDFEDEPDAAPEADASAALAEE